MLKTILKFANDNHWYLIAGTLITSSVLWAYGCESRVHSLVNPTQLINRSELQNELVYIIGQARAREENLDKQDAVKQSLLDATKIMNTTGTINPSGLINLAASIGGISFGLVQRQKRKSSEKEKTTDSV